MWLCSKVRHYGRSIPQWNVEAREDVKKRKESETYIYKKQL